MLVQLHSDFVGPIAPGSKWDLGIFPSSTDEVPIIREQYPAAANPERVGPMMLPQTVHAAPTVAVPQGSQVFVNVKLLDASNNVIDSGVQTVPWESQIGLGNQQLVSQVPVSGGGLTPVQAQQLEDVHVATVVNQLVNAITLVPLTSFPTGDPVNAFLPSLIFGVIVRLASVPPTVEPNTPDGDYWVKTLAVVRIFRGDDLWLRVPIHTSSKIVNLHSEALLMGLAEFTVGAWILNLSLQVTFLEGVTGEVFLMRFP